MMRLNPKTHARFLGMSGPYAAVWGSRHPRQRAAPDRRGRTDLPPQPAGFAPDYASEEIVEIAQKLRQKAGLPDRPTGVVSEESQELVGALTSKVRG